MASSNFNIQYSEQPSLHVQLGTTMSLVGAHLPASPGTTLPSGGGAAPSFYAPAPANQGAQLWPDNAYGKLPSFSQTEPGVATNATPATTAKLLPVAKGQQLYTTRVPITPPAPADASSGSTSSAPYACAIPIMPISAPSQAPSQEPPQVVPGLFPPPRPGPSPAARAETDQPPVIPKRKPSSEEVPTTAAVAGRFSQIISLQEEPEADVESLKRSRVDDTRSEYSRSSISGPDSHADLCPDATECDTVCRVASPDKEEVEAAPSFDRVGILSDEHMAVMVKVSCGTDEGTNNEKFANLVAEIAKALAQYFRKKETEKETMDGAQVEQIIMADSRPVKEHMMEISEALGEDVVIRKADCRRVASKGYIGTYVLENVTYKDRASVSKHGVIVTLKKLNKFACCKEFSEQLCLHILSSRPERLGKGELSSTVESRTQPVDEKCLLTQQFYCDQTCNVYEAGRRSFVEVSHFVLY